MKALRVSGIYFHWLWCGFDCGRRRDGLFTSVSLSSHNVNFTKRMAEPRGPKTDSHALRLMMIAHFGGWTCQHHDCKNLMPVRSAGIKLIQIIAVIWLRQFLRPTRLVLTNLYKHFKTHKLVETVHQFTDLSQKKNFTRSPNSSLRSCVSCNGSKHRPLAHKHYCLKFLSTLLTRMVEIFNDLLTWARHILGSVLHGGTLLLQLPLETSRPGPQMVQGGRPPHSTVRGSSLEESCGDLFGSTTHDVSLLLRLFCSESSNQNDLQPRPYRLLLTNGS